LNYEIIAEYYWFTIFINILCVLKEVRQELKKTDDRENIKIIYYQNESDGLLRKEIYGEKPVLRIIVNYYDSSNSQYIERKGFYNVDFSDPQKIDGSYSSGTFFYRHGNPNELMKSDIKVENGIKTSILYFIENNSKNLYKETIVSLGSKKIISLEDEFADSKKSTKNIHVQKQIYNENQQIIEIDISFFINDKFWLEQKKVYQPPRYSAEKNEPYQIFTSYYDNPEGLIRTEYLYDLANNIVMMDYYNSEFTLNGFTREMTFSIDGKVKRKIYYYDKLLYHNKVYFCSVFYNDDGTIQSKKYFDKDEKEIDQSFLSN
jgi:hypothetical protein